MFSISLLIIAAAIVYMVEAYIHTYYAVEDMHGTPLFFVLLAQYGVPVLFLLLCAHIIYKQTEKKREKKQSETDTQAESKEEKYLTQINAVVGTKAIFSEQADQMRYQVRRFGQKMATAYSMTQDSKTSGEQAKCLILLASAEKIFYDRLDDAIRSASILFWKNPLNDDDWTKSLSLDGAPNFNGVNVSLDELKALPISGYMALNREDEGYSIKGTSNEYDAAEEIDLNIQDYCVTGEEGDYYQIGSYATDGSYAMMLNEDIAKEENMTFGDAFDKGLYYSRINIYDFDWFPAYDSTAQEKFEALYEHFGNPSGLYWKTTSFEGMAFNSFDELKAATYEDVGEAKCYWLVWDCDGYTLAAECYDQFDGKETPQETSVTSIYVFPDADESYISHIDASSIVDGYVGSGSAPLCLSGIKNGQ